MNDPAGAPPNTALGAPPLEFPSLESPRITFYRILPETRMPERGDRSAAGSLPTRAFRYCDPVTTASAFGYYVFPPMDFSVVWDGQAMSWTYEGIDEWLPLTSAQYPNFPAMFDAAAPADIRGFAPPMIAALNEPGILQMWSGFIARTPPGWSLLVRPCANLPQTGGFIPYEGIIETDRWFGPLLSNFRITRTHQPVQFTKDYPILQVQPIPRLVYDEDALNGFATVEGPEDLTEKDWRDFHHTVVRPNIQEDRPRGAYAVTARRRRRGTPAPGHENPG